MSSSNEPFQDGPLSPTSPMLNSLQAAATTNAGLHRSPSSDFPTMSTLRRRSSLAMNLRLNDPTTPAEGEMQVSSGSPPSSSSYPKHRLSTADPNHHQAPSLGELHQELESEQEAHVNRLLHQIRVQQEQITASKASHNNASSPEPSHSHPEYMGTVTEGRTTPPPTSALGTHGQHRSSRRPSSISRQSSLSGMRRPGSGAASPGLHGTSSGHGHGDDWAVGGSRDENAFYQAESQSLAKENQMLKVRIRELERQISEMSTSTHASTLGTSTSPAVASPLASAPAAAHDDVSRVEQD